jgi:hypothetical protein
MILDEASMVNLRNFVLSQDRISRVVINDYNAESTNFMPIFTHLLKLDSLDLIEVFVKDFVERFPVEQFCNRMVRELCLNIFANASMLEHCFRVFPSVTSLQVDFESLLENRFISLINAQENLREFTISGQFKLVYADLTEGFLQQLQIKNLEKVSFRAYPGFLYDRVLNFNAFTKNHPNIKEFKIETVAFGLELIEVILKNLQQLEKLVISTPNLTIAWNQEELYRLRNSKGAKVSWAIMDN